jgi:RNA recognition motif-containing protein
LFLSLLSTYEKMEKDWADQCSSEEEEEELEVFVAQPSSTLDGTSNDAMGHEESISTPTPSERVYEYPTAPPFSAYVGNLAYDVTKDILAEALTALALNILHNEIKIVSARIVMDKVDRSKSRGFGYVEVETVQELQKLMELNQCDRAIISGRRINLDVSTHKSAYNSNTNSRRHSHRNSTSSQRSSGSFGDVDGSKFRQGRYAKRDSGTSNNHTPPTDGSAGEAAAAIPRERPTLILKPRSKMTDSGGNAIMDGGSERSSNLGGSNSNIFGEAKARDEIGWQERRQSETLTTTTTPSTTTDTTTSTIPNGTATPSELPDTTSTPRRDSRGGGGRGRGGDRASARGGDRASARGSGRGSGGGRSSGRGRGTEAGSGGRGERDASAGRGGPYKKKTYESSKRVSEKPKPVAAASAPAVVAPKPPEVPEKKPPKAINAFAALALDSDSD